MGFDASMSIRSSQGPHHWPALFNVQLKSSLIAKQLAVYIQAIHTPKFQIQQNAIKQDEQAQFLSERKMHLCVPPIQATHLLTDAFYEMRQIEYSFTRSLGYSWRPFRPLDFVLPALRAFRPVRQARLRSGPPCLTIVTIFLPFQTVLTNFFFFQF